MGNAGHRRPPLCTSCGQPASHDPCANHWCARADRQWSVVYSSGAYQGPLRRAIVAYKYGDEIGLAPLLARSLAGFLTSHRTWFEEYDLLTGVPTFVGPGSRRDWDPVGRVMIELAAQLGDRWDVRPSTVKKTAETEAMRGRTRFDRRRIAEGHLRSALRAGPDDLSGARILVVDDVFTEGSTLREVARVLRQQGAEEVAGLVLARPPWSSR